MKHARDTIRFKDAKELPDSLATYDHTYNTMVRGYRKGFKQAMVLGSGLLTVILVIILLVLIF